MRLKQNRLPEEKGKEGNGNGIFGLSFSISHFAIALAQAEGEREKGKDSVRNHFSVPPLLSLSGTLIVGHH